MASGCLCHSLSVLNERRMSVLAVSMIVVEMDDSLNLVVFVNQANMAADCDVAVVAWRRRQAARQIERCRVHLLS
jgi:hypothetical protein